MESLPYPIEEDKMHYFRTLLSCLAIAGTEKASRL